jgi:hypothetical protein
MIVRNTSARRHHRRTCKHDWGVNSPQLAQRAVYCTSVYYGLHYYLTCIQYIIAAVHHDVHSAPTDFKRTVDLTSRPRYVVHGMDIDRLVMQGVY